MIGMCLFSLNDNTQAIRSLKESLKIRQLNFTINDDDVAETQFHLSTSYISEMDDYKLQRGYSK